jgi:RimJ/RimL family protein N-acetyltransferase
VTAQTTREVVTYLEMTSPDQLRPARPATVDVDMVRVGPDLVGRYAQIANRVAAPHAWTSLGWSAARWEAFFAWRDLRAWLIRAAGDPAGVLAMAGQPDGNLEILTFGLVPELVGQGIGGHALTLSTRAAWNSVDEDLAPVRRVWLHTSSLDHPNAQRNYRARGFRPFWSRPGHRSP